MASVLNLPREYINDEQYKVDPKRALEMATKKAIDAGSGKARKYRETEHSKVISENMPIEVLDAEIIYIIQGLATLVATNKQVMKEIELGVKEAASSV